MIKDVLILAAGRGKKLDRPNLPKCLVEIGGKKIIFRLIEQFINEGIENIHIVVGFEKDKIIEAVQNKFSSITNLNFIINDQWEKGIGLSALKANEFLNKPFILSMGDHVFDDKHIKLMAHQDISETNVKLLVDPLIKDFYRLDTAVKVLIENKKITDVHVNLHNYNGIDTGLFTCSPQTLFSALELVIHQFKDYNLYKAIDLIAKQGDLEYVFIKEGEWNDVDTPIDLIKAEMRLRKTDRISSIKAKNTHPSKQNYSSYDFIAGKPQITQMAVGRGFINDPESIDLIPEKSSSSPIFVFTDETVGNLYGNKFAKKLKTLGYNVKLLTMADGEESKSLANYVKLTEIVLSSGVDENSVFISVGGGVVCNVCGFIASTIYRGLDLVHIPTSLMAQCDAAISHKQAINGFQGKNMVGSYFSPRLVAVDIETLLTLNKRQVSDGMAEVIKHALGQDVSYTNMLMSYEGDFTKDLDFLENVVRRNVELKCILSKSDPKELSEAMVLQYGHTIGHPVEYLSGYSFYHGESVAIGMVAAAWVSHIMGGCKIELVKTHKNLISKYELPISIPKEINTKNILEALKFNKRYLTEGTRMALLTDVGKLWNVENDYVLPVTEQVLIEAIKLSTEQ
jgi:3-dehydroquinate synthase